MRIGDVGTYPPYCVRCLREDWRPAGWEDDPYWVLPHIAEGAAVEGKVCPFCLTDAERDRRERRRSS